MSIIKPLSRLKTNMYYMVKYNIYNDMVHTHTHAYILLHYIMLWH